MLVGHHLVNAPLVTFDAGERRVQPHVDDLKSQHFARHGSAEAIMLVSLCSRVSLADMGLSSSAQRMPFDLVGRDGHADAGRAADNAAVAFAAGDGLRRRRKVGIVAAVFRVAAEVLIGKATLFEMLHNGVLEIKRAVVTSERS